MYHVSILTHPSSTDSICPEILQQRVHSVLDHPLLNQQLPPSASICVTLSDDQELRRLNRDYRGKDQSTDVLSFALNEGELLWTPPEEPIELGDIVISVDTARQQASRGALPRLSPLLIDYVWTLSDEISFLTLHGLLHLLGYDHIREEEAEEMEALELALLPTLLSLSKH